MRKERLARGWSLRDFSARTGINIGTASQIENGKRPPTENIALKCDEVFPERHGWFLEYYEESKSWTPAGFRNWAEYEDRATRLSAWMPGIPHGLLQTGSYARELLATSLGATPEMTATRLTSRMERQRRVLYREDLPEARFVVDELSLYGRWDHLRSWRSVRHLADIATMPNVTLQVLPATAHPATASGFVVTDARVR